jgi:hypothetical protein
VRTAAFLASRELRRRWGRAALSSLVVAGAVALSVGLELMGRARERAVEAEIDSAGPALRIVPAGISAADAAALRFGDAALPLDVEGRVRAAAAAGIRAVEARAVLSDRDAGWVLIATERPLRGDTAVLPGQVVLGAGLAERSGLRAGDHAHILGRSLVVSSVAPSNADSADFAAHVHAADFGSPAPHELRIFLEPGVRARDAEGPLRAVLPDVVVLRSERGEVADGELQGSITSHRAAVQLVTGLVAALALVIATHLDVSERRRELALLAAMGATRVGLAAVVISRAAVSAAAGAAAGVAVAVAIVVTSPEFLLAGVTGIGAAAVLIATTLAAAAAAPIAIAAAASDPVAELQEG